LTHECLGFLRHCARVIFLAVGIISLRDIFVNFTDIKIFCLVRDK